MTEGPILHFITFLGIILRLVIRCVALTDKRKHREVKALLKSNVLKKVNMLFFLS